METNNNKYKNGKIYRVCDVGYTKFYYGSTVQPLSMRMGGHRVAYNRYIKGSSKYRLDVFSLFDEFGVENCKIELVEHFPCNNKSELERQEGHHIQNNDCENKRIAGRTYKEYYEQNIEKIKKYRQDHKVETQNYNKQYRDQHSDELNDYQKTYRAEHKDNARKYRLEYWKNNKEQLITQARHYREVHKEQIKEQRHKYYQENKSKILESLKEQITCPICNTIYTKNHKARHEKSKKHQQALESKTEPEI